MLRRDNFSIRSPAYITRERRVIRPPIRFRKLLGNSSTTMDGVSTRARKRKNARTAEQKEQRRKRNRGPFVCDICAKTLQHISGFRRHMIVDHGRQVFMDGQRYRLHDGGGGREGCGSCKVRRATSTSSRDPCRDQHATDQRGPEEGGASTHECAADSVNLSHDADIWSSQIRFLRLQSQFIIRRPEVQNCLTKTWLYC